MVGPAVNLSNREDDDAVIQRLVSLVIARRNDVAIQRPLSPTFCMGAAPVHGVSGELETAENFWQISSIAIGNGNGNGFQ